MGTVTKALKLLDHFSASRAEIGLGEFVRLSGRDKATVHRYLTELEQNGFLEQDAVSRAYRLGPALLRLTAVREAAFPMRKLLRPIVIELSEAAGELAHASILEGGMLTPIFNADPRKYGTQVHFDEGERLPMHATASGMAFLAFCDAEFREKIFRGPLRALTNKTITDPDVLRKMIEDIQKNGVCQFARGFDEEVVSQSAPLFGQSGSVIGAISVAVPLVRATPDRLSAIVPVLRDAARAATQSLGGQYPKFPNAADAETLLAQAD